ncbi:MAG: TolC family protein, partial [Planctomycetota bacterium]
MANHPGALPPLTIAAAEAQAVANSPAVATLEAEIRAARCHCLQVGLPPNPTAGYLASEIGNEGQAGQQGAFLGQTFIRGGKLSRAQGVAAQEVRRLEQRLAVERLRLLTDTRIAFYDCQLGQREVELTGRLRETSARAADISSELFEAREAPLTDKLQAEIENRRGGGPRGPGGGPPGAPPPPRGGALGGHTTRHPPGGG